jgi:hypothetical protein
MAVAEFAHPGGEARVTSFGCGRGGTSYSLSQTGAAMIIGGSTRRARALELRFDGGKIVKGTVWDGFFLATPPIALVRRRGTMVITNRDGSTEPRSIFVQAGSGLPAWFTR